MSKGETKQKNKPRDNGKHPGGRPPYYSSPEEMQLLIDEYFKECEGEFLLDNDGDYVLNKYGMPIIIKSRAPSVVGLALKLGFTSRQALINYQERDEYFDSITRAKMKIEEYNNNRLYDKDGVQGAKFNLTVNYGYVDKTETDVNLKGKINIVDDL